MKEMIRLVLLLIGVALGLLPVRVQGQKLGGNYFNTVCEEIERLDRYWQARQKLPPFTLRVDTVKNEEWIEFADGTGKRIKGKTGDAALMKIVHASWLPIFPLKDTVCITDTAGVFQEQATLVNNHYFYIHRRKVNTGKKQDDSATAMYALSMVISETDLYLGFSFAGSDDVFYCRFILVKR